MDRLISQYQGTTHFISLVSGGGGRTPVIHLWKEILRKFENPIFLAPIKRRFYFVRTVQKHFTQKLALYC